jgi:hypothetical protein
MQRHIQLRLSPGDVKHSFKIESDEDVDCVDIDKQPGMRVAEMSGKTVATLPTRPTLPAPLSSGKAAHPTMPIQPAALLNGQDEKGSVRRCPVRTIPVRRIQLEELQAFRDLGEFHRKAPAHVLPPDVGSHAPTDPATAHHEHAHASTYSITNYGAGASFNIWRPSVQAQGEFSLAQLWVTRGSFSDKSLQTLEAGVQVFPQKYGDNEPHLFVYSTSDAYSGNDYHSGCYNLDCGRFIQTSQDVVLGAGTPLTNLSQTDGPQYEIKLAFEHQANGWWLFVNDEPIGYYPLYLFSATGVADHADTIDFGGEIVDDRQTHPGVHTTTLMGSGAFSTGGFGRAAFVRQIFYLDSPTTAQYASALQSGPPDTSPSCYNVSPVASDPSWGGPYFFFGGPGNGTQCP